MCVNVTSKHYYINIYKENVENIQYSVLFWYFSIQTLTGSCILKFGKYRALISKYHSNYICIYDKCRISHWKLNPVYSISNHLYKIATITGGQNIISLILFYFLNITVIFTLVCYKFLVCDSFYIHVQIKLLKCFAP